MKVIGPPDLPGMHPAAALARESDGRRMTISGAPLFERDETREPRELPEELRIPWGSVRSQVPFPTFVPGATKSARAAARRRKRSPAHRGLRRTPGWRRTPRRLPEHPRSATGGDSMPNAQSSSRCSALGERVVTRLVASTASWVTRMDVAAVVGGHIFEHREVAVTLDHPVEPLRMQPDLRRPGPRRSGTPNPALRCSKSSHAAHPRDIASNPGFEPPDPHPAGRHRQQRPRVRPDAQRLRPGRRRHRPHRLRRPVAQVDVVPRHGHRERVPRRRGRSA